MVKKLFLSSLLVLFTFVFSVVAQQKTVVNSQYAKRKLLGRHFLSLQWISWKYYGRAYVRQRRGILYLKGQQKSRENSDYLKIDGLITEISRYEFKFNGKITTSVSYIKGGEACVREGEMTFRITGSRKYWRLQEMRSPCDTSTDYVDIFFRR